MNYELYKLPNGAFKIFSPSLNKSDILPNIEAAADVLESFGVVSDEIDTAIISMTVMEHNRAVFGPANGDFIFSDRIELPV